MIRLIAIDMDGTILSPNHTINTRTKQAIRAANSRGIEVVIATGRSFPEAQGPVIEAGLDLVSICLNGAEIRDKDGELIGSTPMLEQDLTQVLPILEAEMLHYELFIEKHIYTINIEKQIAMFLQLSKTANETLPEHKIRQEVLDRIEQGFIIPVDSYDEVLRQHGNNINKVLAMSKNSSHLTQAREALMKLPGLAISSSGEGNIEINNIHAQKGLAVEQYAKSKGISMKDVMVIGDSYNDVSMMKLAGRSVAMENAPADIKAICTHTTASNEFDGAALAIEAIL